MSSGSSPSIWTSLTGAGEFVLGGLSDELRQDLVDPVRLAVEVLDDGEPFGTAHGTLRVLDHPVGANQLNGHG